MKGLSKGYIMKTGMQDGSRGKGWFYYEKAGFS
jgi:hypothetical protein